jgi:hypothetical protein
MRPSGFTATLLITVVFLTGCSTHIIHPKFNSSQIETLGIKPSFDYTNEHAENYFLKVYENSKNKQATRNRIAFEMMTIIDDNYSQFERNLRQAKGGKDSLVSIVSLTMTGIGSISTGNIPKYLSAADTALKGSNSAIDKNLLGDTLPEVLISKMRAIRASVAKDIYEGLDKPDSSYPLQAVIRDCVRYFSQGTVTSALAALASDTAKEATQNSEAAEKKKQTISAPATSS